MAGPRGKIEYRGFGTFQEKRKPPVKKTQIGYLAGGTGITPCFHVIQSSLRNKDGIKHSMLFGNRTVSDILLHEELRELAADNPVHFNIFFTVDVAPPAEAKWTEGVGFMTKEMIAKYMPAPGPETLILFCGPPAFNKMLKALLPELGYTEDMMFKF